MKKINRLIFISGLFLIITFQTNLFSQIKTKEKFNLRKPVLTNYDGCPNQSVIDISNITSWVRDDGFHDWVVAERYWNGSYPNGENAGVIYTEGIVWGGLVYDGGDKKVRVNGNTYGSGCKAITRLYRVRPDYKTVDLTRDAANFFNKPIGEVTGSDIKKIRDQYKRDWYEWPASEGAMFNDVNHDGTFNPDIDIPGVPGASQTIFIKYDDSKSLSTFASPVIGLEVSETYWAYSNSGAFNNAIFKKVNIVYKGTTTSLANSFIDSMYICQWSDTDLGGAAEDFAGCDTTLNLGYTYNSSNNDKVFSALRMAPPAVGYVILQGVAKYTGNPNDSAIVNLNWRKGFKYVSKNPMSTFIYKGSGGTYSDPSYSYNGAREYFNFMRGRMPIPRYPRGELFPPSFAVTTAHTTYLLPGDPVTGTGIIDGQVDGAGDRRIWLMNGPFTMNLRDTVEAVIAMVIGQGYSNLNSITKLKENTRDITTLFNSLALKLPQIKQPKVEVIPLHNEIVLNWGKNINEINSIENFKKGEYNFEGYEIYQLPGKYAKIEDGVKIDVYDLKNGITAIYDTVRDVSWVNIPKLQVRGKDKGITRFISITRDTLNETFLIDGHTYYFGVVSYAVNTSSVFSSHIIRSPLKVIEAVPQKANPGVRYNSVFGDTLTTYHIAGKGKGKILPIVVDPTKTDGKTYQIIFDTVGNKIVWNLKEKVSGAIVLSNQTNLSGDNDYPIIKGIMPKVIALRKGIKEWKYKGCRWISGVNYGKSQFFGGMDIGEDFWNKTEPMINYVSIELRFTGGSGKETPSETNGWSQGAVYRRDRNYSYSGIGWLPFTACDISDPLNPRQVNISFVEDSVNGSANLKWDMGWDGNHFSGKGDNEYIIISNTDYDPSFYNENNNAIKKAMYIIWPKNRGSRPYLYSQFSMKIIPNETNLPGDIYEYTAPEVIIDKTLAKKDVEEINVFPNPYYTFETSDYVTFNHLPNKATIRIFDLSGVLVRTIKHEGKENQFERWYLNSNNNIAIASGIYIVQIDMPELSKTKILKLAIVSKY